jgi:hypothetical protein
LIRRSRLARLPFWTPTTGSAFDGVAPRFENNRNGRSHRLELLHQLLPTVNVMALLVNPADRALAQSQAREVLSAARNRGLELHKICDYDPDDPR